MIYIVYIRFDFFRAGTAFFFFFYRITVYRGTPINTAAASLGKRYTQKLTEVYARLIQNELRTEVTAEVKRQNTASFVMEGPIFVITQNKTIHVSAAIR